jgi:hypothetical protein
MASNNWITVKTELEGMWKDAVMAYHVICLDELMQNLGQVGVPPKFELDIFRTKSKASQLGTVCSVSQSMRHLNTLRNPRHWRDSLVWPENCALWISAKNYEIVTNILMFSRAPANAAQGSEMPTNIWSVVPVLKNYLKRKARTLPITWQVVVLHSVQSLYHIHFTCTFIGEL